MHLLPILVAGVLGVAEMQEFYQDFRDGKALAPALEIAGPQSSATLTPSAAGLVVFLPADRLKTESVGVRYPFPVRGDFEIVGTYEVMRAQEPTKGFGVGVSLVIRADMPTLRTATVARYPRPGKKEVLVGDEGLIDAKNKEKHLSRTLPAPATKIGRFQLRRRGIRLEYLSGNGATGDLELFHQIEFVKDNLAAVRFCATSGGASAAVEVRLIDLRIRADQLLNPDGKIGGAGVRSDRSISLEILGLLLALAVVGVLGYLWFWLSKKKLPPSDGSESSGTT